MSARGTFRVAAVQATPVYLDREATLDVAAEHITQAGEDRADLVVFPESFVPGYPDWLWRQNAWSDDQWYARFHNRSVEVPGPALAEPLVGEAERVTATLDRDLIATGRRAFDPTGH